METFIREKSHSNEPTITRKQHKIISNRQTIAEKNVIYFFI